MRKQDDFKISIPENMIPRTGGPSKEKLRRLSPGVYRNAAGALVGSGGQSIGSRRPNLRSIAEQFAESGGPQSSPSKPSSVADIAGNAKPARPNSAAESAANAKPPKQAAPSIAELAGRSRPAKLSPNLDLSNLYDELRQTLDSTPAPQMPSNPQVGSIMGNARVIKPWERPALGIDPRDPNIYYRGEDGKIGGTYMAWDPNPRKETIQELMALSEANRIPRASNESDFVRRLRGGR